jgi:5-methylcytosine-specific restriction endonuclease McrA
MRPRLPALLDQDCPRRRDDKGPPARPDDLCATPSGLPVFAHTHLEHEHRMQRSKVKPSDHRYHLGVPDGRPPIPQPLVRRILLEAGHRCAIPTCRAHPVEIAHIVPWSRAKEHAYENLIALCPTCHSRYDRGEIDRTSVLQYKERLRQLWDVERKEQSSERAMQVDAFCNLAATMRMWLDSIAALANAEVSEEAYEFMDPAT